MPQSTEVFMSRCAGNVEIQKYIKHLAKKIAYKYPRLLAVGDAENELWVAVFRAITERYKSPTHLKRFALDAVFSQFGSMIKRRSNAARIMNEEIPSVETLAGVVDKHYSVRRSGEGKYHIPIIDPSYAIVEACYTLDQIEQALKKRAQSSRQYRMALKTFELLREGSTMVECCTRLKISSKYGYRLFKEAIKECSERYDEWAITVQ